MCMSSCGCLLSDQKIISFAVSVSELLIFASLLTGWHFLSGKRHSRLYILQSLRSCQHLHWNCTCGVFIIPHYKALKLCERGLSIFIPSAQTLFKGFRNLSYFALGQFLFVIFLRHHSVRRYPYQPQRIIYLFLSHSSKQHWAVTWQGIKNEECEFKNYTGLISLWEFICPF